MVFLWGLSMRRFKTVATLLSMFLLISCSSHPPLDNTVKLPTDYTYIVGPGDSIEIFVWDNPDISKSVTVRPDGKISTPLIDDLVATGKTPSELARDIEDNLSQFVREPLVSVIVNGFEGIYEQQIRVIGQLEGGGGGQSNSFSAQAFPYKKDMTLLDLLIELGGLGEYADGNRSSIFRRIDGTAHQFGIKIDDLLEGDVSANIKILPGDVLLIPEAFF